MATGCTCDSRGCDSDEQVAAARITLTASTGAPELVPGGTVQVTLTPTFTAGPTRATLSVANVLPGGVTATLVPTSVAAGGTSVLTLTADSTARAGRFVFDVAAAEAGTNFGVNTSTTLTGNVLVPFGLTTPNGRSITVGTVEEFTIGVSRTPSFTAPVGIVVDAATVPAGTGIVIAPPTVIGASALVRLNVPLSAPTGQYLVRTIGRYGASLDTARFLLTVLDVPVPPDFTLASTPATSAIVPGGTATMDIATTRNIGTLGMGNIVLTVSGVPTGATATFTPSNVATANSQFVVTTTPTIADGSYPLVITATLGALAKAATTTLVVATPANFALSLTPAALTVARNATAVTTVGIQRTGPVAAVSIDAVSLPPGVTMTPNSIAATAQNAALTFNVSNTTAPGTYPIIIRGISGALARTTTLSLTIPIPPPSPVTIQLLTPNVSATTGSTIKIPIRLTRTGNAIGQLLELRLAGFPIGGHAWIAPSVTVGDSATLTVVAGTPGVARIVVTAALGAFPPSDVANLTVTPATAPDFAILPAPQTLNMSTGSFIPMGVEIWRTNGFTGAVSFQATGDIAGQYQFRFSLTQTTGSAVGFEIYASPTVPVGPHLISIRGTSGSVVREVTMTIVVSEPPPYTPPYYPNGIRRPPP